MSVKQKIVQGRVAYLRAPLMFAGLYKQSAPLTMVLQLCLCKLPSLPIMPLRARRVYSVHTLCETIVNLILRGKYETNRSTCLSVFSTCCLKGGKENNAE